MHLGLRFLASGTFSHCVGCDDHNCRKQNVKHFYSLSIVVGLSSVAVEVFQYALGKLQTRVDATAVWNRTDFTPSVPMSAAIVPVVAH